ncbi:hypothetical protein TTHERM_000556750 (macronuclear) [Tetrahymena thermophila SB210]|uniref:Uncharacterized protein n=1 Tax=Tetrahymena thermophila (strain SB210) TaxID=312017 RepID=W7X5R5_TETTS|nr:hypothetical protein TTHERM_000556750 [Tetrahymena thermophila SB210]EWS72737.1 hypothetical protein TTHERM_000556750 [Tetrahymena thermophila SB210]|eukprot:XP_012654715.1 hypothetical protein TTHERM_000556750 [Tetrahymena thermophila SB210]
MQDQSQNIFKSFLGNNNEYFYVNYNIAKPNEPYKSKEITDYEKRMQNQKPLDLKNQQLQRQHKEEYQKFQRLNEIFQKDYAIFTKQINSYLNKLFREIFQNEQLFFAFKKIKYQPEIIKKDVCFLIGQDESWNYEYLFKAMNCNMRSREYKLDDYRIQESPFKQEERKLQLRIVKPYSQRYGDRQNNKLGDFILLQIIEIQSDSNPLQFNPNNLQSEKKEQDEKQEQNKMIDRVVKPINTISGVKIEEVVNSDGDDIQLNQKEFKKIPNSSILPQSKAIIKDKTGSYQIQIKEENVDTFIQENLGYPEIQSKFQSQQQSKYIIINATDQFYSSHNLSSKEQNFLYDNNKRYQNSTKNVFNKKQESDDEDNFYEYFQREDLIQMLKERDALTKLKWIQEGIEKAQNFRKDLRNQNPLIYISRFHSNEQK